MSDHEAGEHTPTMGELRELYVIHRATGDKGSLPAGKTGERAAGQEFDRAVAAHTLQVAAQAVRDAARRVGHAEDCRADPDRDPYVGCACRMSLVWAYADRVEACESL